MNKDKSKLQVKDIEAVIKDIEKVFVKHGLSKNSVVGRRPEYDTFAGPGFARYGRDISITLWKDKEEVPFGITCEELRELFKEENMSPKEQLEYFLKAIATERDDKSIREKAYACLNALLDRYPEIKSKFGKTEAGVEEKLHRPVWYDDKDAHLR